MDHRARHHQRSQSHSTGPVAHSTPSKASSKLLRFADTTTDIDLGADMPDGAALPSTRFAFKRDLPSYNSTTNTLTEMERDTIIKQRTELQLLISELRDRDKELNEMVHAHHTEMKAWEEDRNRTQSLEQKCGKLDRDLNKRNNQIRELLKKLKAIESEAVDSSSALDNTRHQLQILIEEHSTACQQLRDLEEYNAKLQDSFKDTSQSLGDTEGKVAQLQHLLEIKDKEAVVTNKEVTDLASRLQSLEYSYKQLEKITFDVKTSANEWKSKYTETKHGVDGLKNELDISNATMEEKDEETDRLRRQLREKLDELTYTVEREKRKDQMLALQKSKQERADTELSTLRQMYDLQQHKLAATRKELNEIKEKDIKYKCSFSHPDESSLFDITTTSLKYNSPNTSHSPSRSHRSPTSSRSVARSLAAVETADEVVTLEGTNPAARFTGRSSTERLQKLLSDSKRLVETITSNESRSPTHMAAQLSLSAEET